MTNRNTLIHGLINLRSKLSEAHTETLTKKYGANSATVNSKYFLGNCGLFVSFTLKPVLLSHFATK